VTGVNYCHNVMNDDVSDLCTEVLSVCPGSSTATVVIGLTQKGFRPGHEPGNVDKSIGFKPSTGW